MAKYNAATLVKILRERIGLEREAMHRFNQLDEINLKRIEGDEQNPKSETLESLLKAIDLPLEGLVYSPIEDQPMDVIHMCDELTQLLSSVPAE